MKKTKLFSRIFAAALAAAITATTLITNSGAGLLAFATEGEGDDTTPSDGKYKVTITSPDVPSSGTYTYKFYQILKGNVEVDGDNNVISGAEWGDAFGSAFTTEKITLATDTAGSFELTKDQILITSFDGNVQANKGNFSSANGKYAWLQAVDNLGGYFCATSSNAPSGLYQTYGGSVGSISTADKFQFDNRTDNGKYYPRTAVGFTEMLNKDVTNSPILKAFTDLLYNGIPAGTATDAQTADIKFLDPNYEPTEVKIDGTKELTVRVKPGYYLIACVDGDGNLTSDGKTKPKPVSAMLLLVGPNEEANKIVGKNTTAVATVDLKMFNETIGFTPLADDDPAKYSNYIRNKMAWVDNDDAKQKVFTDANWVDRASYGNLKRSITEQTNKPNQYRLTGDYYFDEFVLYRVDVTLPENFESYEDVGYFLAIFGDWVRGGDATKVCRATSCRPSVYVKHGNETPKWVCEIGYDNTDEYAGGFSGAANDTNNSSCNPLGNNSLYNTLSGYDANEIMYLGDLFNKDVYGEGDAPAEGEKDSRTIPFKGGDHIYIYFPAYFASKAASVGEKNLVKPAHTWAVYSNNPHSTNKASGKLSTVSNWKTRYIINGHVNSGDVGISAVPETNINAYSLKVNVGGSVDDVSGNGNKFFDTNNSFYALYRLNSDGKKEYALLTNGYDTDPAYCVGWYTIPQIKEYFNNWDQYGIVKGEGEKATIKADYARIDESKCSATFMVKQAEKKDGKIVSYSQTINGLAPGKYYIEELTITYGGATTNTNTYHYEQATKPFEVIIGQEYNLDNSLPSATPFIAANKNYLIGKLSVDFEQYVLTGETKDRTIDTKILKPLEATFDTEKNEFVYKTDDDGHVVAILQKGEGETDLETYATQDGEVEVLITHSSLHLIWLPETGGIGTTIFFIVGGAIVVAATVLIVTRFRVKRERL